MENLNLKAIIEAILFVADEPVSLKKIADVVGIPTGVVKKAIEELKKEYEERERGFQLLEVAGGYRFYSHPAYAPYIEEFILSTEYKRLTQAAIETLTIIAYKQPITKSEINAIRGVNSEATINTLIERGLVKEIGRRGGTGQPILYGVTPYFLEVFGLKSIKDLPPLEEFSSAQDDANLKG